MKRFLRRASKKKPESTNDSSRFVQPDEDLNGVVRGNRPNLIEGESSLPDDWRRRSRRSQASRTSRPDLSIDVGQESTVDVDDLFSDEIEIDVMLNPDMDVQLDADEEDFDKFDLPSPGSKEPSPKARDRKVQKQVEEKQNARLSRRLSSRMTKLVGSATTKEKKKKDKKSRKKNKDEQEIGKENETEVEEPKRVSLRSPKSPGLLARTSKRISFRKPPSAAKLQRKIEKERIKQEKKEEKKRLERIKKDPWFPANVNFRYLSPKSKWTPYLGRDANRNELDFGNEARLVGAVA